MHKFKKSYLLSNSRREKLNRTALARILLTVARRRPDFANAPAADCNALKQILDRTKNADLDLIVEGGILSRSRAEAAALALIESGKMRLTGSAMLKSLNRTDI